MTTATSLLAALSALAVTAPAPDAAAPPTPLETGSKLARDLAPGGSDRYRVRLAPGEFLHVAVDQLGIDVALAVIDPAGRRLGEMDTPTGERGREEISAIAESTGDYVVVVESSDPEGPAGKYEIVLTERRTAAPADRTRLKAESSSAEGHRLAAAADAKSQREGVVRLSAALPLWRELGDRRGEALTLYGLGRAHQVLRESPDAIARYREALALWAALGERGEQASTLFGLATVETTVGKNEEALVDFQEALSLERSLGNRGMEAEILTSLGSLYNVLGEKAVARDRYFEALPLMRTGRNRPGELRTLNSLAYLYDFEGEKQKALDAYRQALTISRELKLASGQAMVLGNLGRLYAGMGEDDRALACLSQALQIRRRQGDRGGEATVLLYMGQVASARGRYREAIDLYVKALPSLPPVEGRRKEAAARCSLGEAYLASGDPGQALASFEQALALAEAAGDRYLQAAALTDLGAALTSLGRMDEALERLSRALTVRREIGDRPGEAETSFRLARLERARGDLRSASRRAQEALELVEAQRVSVSSPDLRASYLATVQSFYELAIDLLMALDAREGNGGFAAAALETAERARARGFLELIGESGIDVRSGVDPALLERERSVRLLLKGKLERRIRLSEQRERSDAQATAAASREILDLTARLEGLEKEIRASSPRFASLTSPAPSTATEIQRELLDEKTALLEYSLGEERSHLWVVTPTRLVAYELPPRAQIEPAARRISERISSRRLADAADLGRMLLAPAAAELTGRRLVIVADGALQYVPFAALPDPDGARPLIVSHEIVSLPSASALAALRQETRARQRAPKVLAVFADPVFDAEDERVRGGAARARVAPAASPAALEREAPSEESLPRLLYTRREARAILDLARPAERMEALDFAASRPAATDPRLGDYRFLHFATHGFFDDRRPELSGIVLSRIDAQGRSRDGLVTSHDIFDLRLSSDLVVLSACRTALGREIRGEGLVGLTRGFFYAGAARVVASLWTVGDVATARLMKRFYGEMLGAKRASPAAALRAAQIELLKTGRWSDPYYWAGFVLQGEWN